MASPVMTPPLPPELAGSQQQPGPQGVFMNANGGQPAGGGIDPMQIVAGVRQKTAELKQWAMDTMMLLEQINPALKAILVPVAQVGNLLDEQLTELEKGNQVQQTPGLGMPSGEVPQRAMAA